MHILILAPRGRTPALVASTRAGEREDETMETRTVWTVRYKGSNGIIRKAEYFCLTERQARKMFLDDNGEREIISVLGWREDMRRYGK